MDPIQVELVGQSSIPWNSIIAATAAIFASIGTGFLGYKWQGRNLDKQLAARANSEKIARNLQILEQTLVPLRDSVAEIRSSLTGLSAAAYSGWKLDEASERYEKSVESFSVETGKVTDTELGALTVVYMDKIFALAQPYFRNNQNNAARKELATALPDEIADISSAGASINKRIEQLLRGEGVI